MRLYVIGFAVGVGWLQMQSRLPGSHWYWVLLPCLLAAVLAVPLSNRAVRLSRVAFVAAGCAICGFLWAVWCAEQRLADALPEQWEGQDVLLVGVIASMPQQYERSLRFEFDVERVVTPQAYSSWPYCLVVVGLSCTRREGRDIA
jgi:competence protein ComEC